MVNKCSVKCYKMDIFVARNQKNQKTREQPPPLLLTIVLKWDKMLL